MPAYDRLFTAITLEITIVKLSYFPTYSIHNCIASERVPPVDLTIMSLPKHTKANFDRHTFLTYTNLSLKSKIVTT